MEDIYVVIVEQPATRINGHFDDFLIKGVNSTLAFKSFPSIEIHGYVGRAYVTVSLVSKNPPHWPHPFNLVERYTRIADLLKPQGPFKLVRLSNTAGVLKYKFNADSIVSFKFLEIQRVQQNQIVASLQRRESLGVDPFQTGYSHQQNSKNIDLNAVRLCFEVFLINDDNEIILPLKPIISDPIYVKKVTLTDLIFNDFSDNLIINHFSDNSCSVIGGKIIILLCKKINKKNIRVRFYEENDGEIVWEAFREFIDVFRQVAITFKTPPYKTIDICEPVCVFVQLQRETDKMTSQPLPFFYTPDDTVKKSKLIEDDGTYTFTFEGQQSTNIDCASTTSQMQQNMAAASTATNNGGNNRDGNDLNMDLLENGSKI